MATGVPIILISTPVTWSVMEQYDAAPIVLTVAPIMVLTWTAVSIHLIVDLISRFCGGSYLANVVHTCDRSRWQKSGMLSAHYGIVAYRVGRL